MTYYILQNHKGEKIGSRYYLVLSAARRVAKQTAGKWRKNPELRGGAIKIVRYDDSLYPGTVEWVEA